MKQSSILLIDVRFDLAMNYWCLALLVVYATAICGCGTAKGTAEPKTFDDTATWTITELNAELGHDTIKPAEGGMYHNYYYAVVFKHKSRSINLIYQNRLPGNVDLKIGNQYQIHGLDDASRDEIWNGYWIHDLELQRFSETQ